MPETPGDQFFYPTGIGRRRSRFQREVIYCLKRHRSAVRTYAHMRNQVLGAADKLLDLFQLLEGEVA